MELFTFNLAKGTKIDKTEEQYFISSEIPIRFMFLNKSLYELLKKISEGYSYHKLLENKTLNEKKAITKHLLTLVSKGYLNINLYSEAVESFPYVSVIIPVKNRPHDINDCLLSLMNIDYPKDKLEIIVVDDGSTDNTREVICSFNNVKLICNPVSKGPAESRNIGVSIARGDILAFVDSDCTVEPSWIKEIIPFFTFDGVGAVGGGVKSYYHTTYLDKYEEAFSSLNMGKRVIFEVDISSNFYVPSCNLFVKKEAFEKSNGFKKGMHLGEDVDFCWRLRNIGYYLLYVPLGSVKHKHRNTLLKMLKRKLQYGTSEADLYLHHQYKRKKLFVPLYAGLAFITFCTSFLLQKPSLLLLTFLFFFLDVYKKSRFIDRYVTNYSIKWPTLSALRSMFSFHYFMSFYLIRYYIILIMPLGVVFANVFYLCFTLIFITSIVDYKLKTPKINYLIFLFFYINEQIAYQIGVLLGCLKYKYFKCYLPELKLNSIFIF